MAKLTRRNTIIGLGALVGGTGALAASGAFTTVEAERAVNIETAGDDTALLQIDLDDSYVGLEDGEDDAIEIIGDDINLNAITTFDGALTITPTGDSGPYDLDILDDFGGTSLVSTSADTTDNPSSRLQFIVDDASDLDGITSGNSVEIDLVINTMGEDNVGNIAEFVPDDSIVIEATEQ